MKNSTNAKRCKQLKDAANQLRSGKGGIATGLLEPHEIEMLMDLLKDRNPKIENGKIYID